MCKLLRTFDPFSSRSLPTRRSQEHPSVLPSPHHRSTPRDTVPRLPAAPGPAPKALQAVQADQAREVWGRRGGGGARVGVGEGGCVCALVCELEGRGG